MRIDVEGKACPICVLATSRREVESRRLATVHGRSLLPGVHAPASVTKTAYPIGEDVRLAHELIAFAIEEGVPEHRWRPMVVAHLRQGDALSRLDDLLPLAWNLGLDVERTARVLASGRYRSRLAGGCPLPSSSSERALRPQPALRPCANS